MKLTFDHVPDDMISPEVASELFFLLSSRSRDEDFKSFFAGVGYTENEVLISLSGLSSAFFSDRLIDGRYTLGERQGDRYVLQTDNVGQSTIYLWRGAEGWAVSNSLFAIVREMRQLGANPSINWSALAGYPLGDSGTYYGQPLSCQTSVNHVFVVPANQEVHISLRDLLSPPTLKTRYQFSDLIGSTNDYLDHLKVFVHQWRSRISTMLNSGIPCHLMLSGGKDSRSIMAIMHSVGIANANLYTRDNGSVDQPIATSLIKNFTQQKEFFEGPNTADTVASTTSEAFAIQMLSGAGVRKAVHPGPFLSPLNCFVFNGGSSFDAAYSMSSVRHKSDEMLKRNDVHDRRVQQLAADQYLESMATFGIDPSSQLSSVFHYLGFRSKFHYGMRDFVSNSSFVMPLASISLMKLVLSAPSAKYLAEGGANFDIISACSPELLSVPFAGRRTPFDTIAKDVGSSLLEEPKKLQLLGEFPDNARLTTLPRVSGLSGLQVLQRDFSPASKAFERFFGAEFIQKAEIEMSSKRLAACPNAALLCGLYDLKLSGVA